MAWTIGCLIATIAITLIWHSIDPKGDFWLACACLAGGVLLAAVAIKYWMIVIPFVGLAGLAGAIVWYMRQPQSPNAALARVSEGRKN
jgi:predicted MFS family arabinose efflux permease